VIISGTKSSLTCQLPAASAWNSLCRSTTAGFLFITAAILLACGTQNNGTDPVQAIGVINRSSENEITQGRQVKLRGVVIVADAGGHLLVIQDETGGVLVDWPPLARNVELGDTVEVDGATSVDNHVRSIVAASLHDKWPQAGARNAG
jgi:hypothetical protein